MPAPGLQGEVPGVSRDVYSVAQWPGLDNSLNHRNEMTEAADYSEHDDLALEASTPERQVAPSASNPFNKVSKLWKPTIEYFANPWQYFADFVQVVKDRGGRFITMSQAVAGDYDPGQINVLLDHHIDFYPIETEVMTRWEQQNGVVSSIYLFNRFDYDDTFQRRLWVVEDLNIPLYQELERSGFEVGYHQNAVGLVRNRRLGRTYSKSIESGDLVAAQRVFSDDVDNLRRYFDIRTFIPHGSGEGNAQLTDIPDGYDDLVWVYNNASRNGTCTPPLKWRNFTDSNGPMPQRIRGYTANYVAHVDNLHVNAYLMTNGLNHVLVHPGRYAKGMPYDLYDNRNSPISEGCVKAEFAGVSGHDLPLSAARVARSYGWQPAQRRPVRERSHKYYLFTDDVPTLIDHLTANDQVVGTRIVHRRISAEEKLILKIRRPISTTFSFPRPGGAGDSDSEQTFLEEFRSFYNDCYCPNVLQHLAACGFPLDEIILRDVVSQQKKDATFLARVLHRLHPGSSIELRVRIPEVAYRQWNKAFEKCLEPRSLKVELYSHHETGRDGGVVLTLCSDPSRQCGCGADFVSLQR